MAEVDVTETITEAREELMVSVHGEDHPRLRLAYFFKPSIEQHPLEFDIPPPPKLPTPNCFEFEKLLNSVKFKSLLSGSKWKEWVHILLPRYRTTWIKSGILDAILASTYDRTGPVIIRRDNELVLRVAENWCSETNTFIFPWGEATITLEDMMVLGGFSVLGESVTMFRLTPAMKQVEKKLVTANRKMKKLHARSPRTSLWMDYFMGTGHELEHEAFLTLWLARFVFPRHCSDNIVKWYFHIAVGLARGTLIALAPAVLASIYRDMSLLRGRIAEFNEGLDVSEVPRLELTAPFQLVKLWIWERFPKLRPHPNAIKEGEPRSAMWHNIKRLEAVNVRLTIDTSGECFQWLPYGETTCISSFCRSYTDKGHCEDYIRDRESFARCVRVSELVGIDNGIQKYLPHRVAMQFGYDLDIPARVIRCINAPEIAWNVYNRPFNSADLHIPPEHELEHEAFLTLWLARFVFPIYCHHKIVKCYFHIAVGLARETLNALAPAVLASIYRDMSILRGRTDEFNEGLDVAERPRLEVTAPLQLVKLWIWERFPKLRPNPNGIKEGEPRSAMWHNIKRLKVVNVRLTIDTSGEYFQCLPYGATTCISSFCRFYRDKEQWLPDCEDCIREIESFARCVRVSDLVGIDNCIQKYLPHRVAMQFGYDLDIPASVIRFVNVQEIAWNYYNRPFNCADLHIPSSLRDSCTTFRYIQWWRKSYVVQTDVSNGILKRGRRSPRVPPTVKLLKVLECFVSKQEFDRRGHINDTTPCMNSDCTQSVHSTAAKVGESEEAETDGTFKINVGGASIAVPVKSTLFGTSDKKLLEEVILGNADEEMETAKIEFFDSPVKNSRSCGDDQTRSIGMEFGS